MNQLESHGQTDFYEYVQNYTNYLQQLATCLPKWTTNVFKQNFKWTKQRTNIIRLAVFTLIENKFNAHLAQLKVNGS